MSEMVDGIADILMSHGCGDSDQCEKTARAILEYIREPTDEMHHGARYWSLAKYGRPIGREASDGCWRAMIDEALKSESAEVKR